ncbi:MAG: V-type ATPase subunit [Treponema sp.]|nr:V-type ATPase subunit [Treponema sp.]
MSVAGNGSLQDWRRKKAAHSRGKKQPGQRAYAYAKACGIIGRSFVGGRAAALNSTGRLHELDRLIFPNTSVNLPEKELLKDLEKRITGRAFDSIQKVVKSFTPVPEFLVMLIRGWEYENLKLALTAIAANENSKPVFTDIKKFATVDFSLWPDLNAMLKNTEFTYILKIQDKGSISVQTGLDRQYYFNLWNALCGLRGNDRIVSEAILAEEIALRNVVCAMRLRSYYQMEKNMIIPHLINIKTKIRGITKNLAKDALSSLDIPLDNRQQWTAWKRAKFINPEDTPASRASGGWKLDPRYFQNEAAKYLYRLARRNFRFKPSSLDTVFCFIKIKQFEEEVLTSCAEGLGMGMTAKDALAILGADAQ